MAFAGNDLSGGALEGSGRFGTYYMAADTVSPRLRPRVEDGENLPASGRFSIEASDYESGVASYDAQWDGEWILSQYVGGRIQIYPDDSHRTGGRHTVAVIATDHCGNSSAVEFEVIY